MRGSSTQTLCYSKPLPIVIPFHTSIVIIKVSFAPPSISPYLIIVEEESTEPRGVGMIGDVSEILRVILKRERELLRELIYRIEELNEDWRSLLICVVLLCNACTYEELMSK